ncbi:MotA/TolQ/ExbB proton channel family protein [candidate division KSB1 bacterium]|nr:MotA/TolQ/ExbB proton channel family protein [candidate division KSB1 bacterium]
MFRYIFFIFMITSGAVFAGAAPDNVIATQNGTSIFDKVMSTGLTGLVLLSVSISGLAFIFERLSNLRRSRIVPEGIVEKADTLWSEKKYDDILDVAHKNDSTLGRIIRALVKNRHVRFQELSAMAGDLSSRELRMHLHKAYPLAVIATVSPLLGLMGTVFGMIGAFDAISSAKTMGDPTLMAGSISYALMTTAIGLVIAVPALASYHYFRIRTNMLALVLEEKVNDMLNKWFLNGKDDHAN